MLGLSRYLFGFSRYFAIPTPGGATFTWDPSSPTNALLGTYRTWAEVYAAAAEVTPSRIRFVRLSTIPASDTGDAWDIEGIGFYGGEGAAVDVRIGDGAVLDFVSLELYNVNLSSHSAGVAIVVPTGRTCTVKLAYFALLDSAGSDDGAVAMFNVQAGGILDIEMMDPSALAATAAPVVAVDAGGTCYVTARDACDVADNTLTGQGEIDVTDASAGRATISHTQTGATNITFLP